MPGYILSNNIEDIIKSISNYQNSVGVVVGALYLAGEVLNLN